jgi:hypothetical protein
MTPKSDTINRRELALLVRVFGLGLDWTFVMG